MSNYARANVSLGLGVRERFFQNEYLDPQLDPSLREIGNVRAAIVVLTRNSDLTEILRTMKQFEGRWNRRYNYPYVFLNDGEFSQRFKDKTSAATRAKTFYGTIPQEMWSYPSWINQTKAAEVRAQMAKDQIIYGDSESYRHMCRFYSGFFFHHPLLKKYDYYWRVEPGVKYNCDINYDPFAFMQKYKIKYGFTLSLMEYRSTIATLWDTVRDFIDEYPNLINPNNFTRWISDDDLDNYNLCHFWSNFEIGDLNFWRSEAYTKFFDYLDKSGGFFYERWGDAPVHSIAAALFLEKSDVHFFNDIAYRHEPFEHCPPEPRYRGNCQCNVSENFDMHWYSCTRKWFEI
ncbi:268_t:CDS:2 [Paraglomus occultum]|uniref:268_t:CDS:1 n=1 Tax=Paraglomus occultum TaxID=144539 RepID=A0A9N9FY57_9GLOM|nr:268_t:CDS:2 [Paraglomus occultum]